MGNHPNTYRNNYEIQKIYKFVSKTVFKISFQFYFQYLGWFHFPKFSRLFNFAISTFKFMELFRFISLLVWIFTMFI